MLKFFTLIVLSFEKENIFKNMSKFQIASKPGHRSSEHLFVLKSVFALYNSRKKGLIISSFDLKSFFDTENLFDCMNELYRSEVKGKTYRLLFEVNKKAKLKVNTPVGISESKETGPNIQQGSVDGAITSSVNIDKGVNDAFASSDCEVVYVDLPLKPQIFMDDIFRMAEDRESAQFANTVMEEMVEKKLLSFNNDKSCYTFMGNKTARKRLKAQCVESPLMLNGDKMKEVKVVKYLGDYLCQDLEESVHQTVVKRLGLAKHAAYELRTIIEDTRVV